MIRNRILVLLTALIITCHTNSDASAASMTALAHEYYVSVSGNDANAGTENAPWLTVKKAVSAAAPGDTIYLRGGQYDGLKNGWVFSYSGTESQPITLTNYPGEQAVLRITTASDNNQNLFRCSRNPSQPESWQTPKADYIRIIGTNVSQHILPNGVESSKGIVMLGMEGEQSSAIIASDCDHWEVAGVDFIEIAYGIFTHKNNWHLPEEHSTDHWYVHDNRVYNYYRESGLQFDGNYNVIENNEIFKVSDRLDTPYGCQMLNLLGNNNIVRGNTLSRMGSAAECSGILFEWDISDANLIENNLITDVMVGISFQGGDSNLIQNNIIIAADETTKPGVLAASYNNQTTWPCDDYINSGSSAEALLPPNDPSHPDYPYYYNPRNCHSMNNRIQNNLILGFNTAWVMYPVQENSNIFSNNSTLGITHILLADPTPAFDERIVAFNIDFSKAVNGVDINDFSLTTTGVTGASITGIAPVSTSAYTVSVYTGSGNGTIRLDVPSTATITDMSGNALTGLPFESGEVYTITKTVTRAVLPSNGSQDGWVLESSETSESGDTMDASSTVLMVGDDASNRQYRSMLSFDTSSLPDTAVITQAVLSLRINEVLGGGNPIKTFNYFMADVMSGSFGSSSYLVAQDFGFSPTVSAGPLGALNRGGWYYVDLKTGKPAINPAGLTQVRLRFSIGDNDNGIANIIKIYSGNSAIKPQLSLWYYVP